MSPWPPTIAGNDKPVLGSNSLRCGLSTVHQKSEPITRVSAGSTKPVAGSLSTRWNLCIAQGDMTVSGYSKTAPSQRGQNRNDRVRGSQSRLRYQHSAPRRHVVNRHGDRFRCRPLAPQVLLPRARLWTSFWSHEMMFIPFKKVPPFGASRTPRSHSTPPSKASFAGTIDSSPTIPTALSSPV